MQFRDSLYESVEKYLMRISFQKRFEIYNTIQQSYLFDNPYILNPEIMRRTKLFFSRICQGDHQIEENQRNFKILVETNPFYVGNLMITEIKSYQTLINSLNIATQNVNKIVKDILIF